MQKLWDRFIFGMRKPRGLIMHGILKQLKKQQEWQQEHTPAGHLAVDIRHDINGEEVTSEEITEAANRLEMRRKTIIYRIGVWTKTDALNKPHTKRSKL